MTAIKNEIINSVSSIMWHIMTEHKAGRVNRSRAKQTIELIFETEHASLYAVRGITPEALNITAANGFDRPKGKLHISHLIDRTVTFDTAMSANSPHELFSVYVSGGDCVISTVEENSDVAHIDYICIPGAFERGLFKDGVKNTTWGKRERAALEEIYNAHMA